MAVICISKDYIIILGEVHIGPVIPSHEIDQKVNRELIQNLVPDQNLKKCLNRDLVLDRITRDPSRDHVQKRMALKDLGRDL